MKNILKNILCTSLTAALLISHTGVFASEETNIPIEDYMYDAKTVYVDDDLEGGSMYPISTALNASNSATEEDINNTAVKLNSWSYVSLVPAGSLIDGDKLVVSFGIKPTGASFSEAVASGAFDKSLRSFIAFGIYAGGTGETGKLGLYSGTALDSSANESLKGWITWGSGTNISVPQTNDENNGYVKAVAVYERVKNEGSDTYSVYMRNLYFNGKDVLTDALRGGSNANANWWSDASNVTLKIQNRTGSGTPDTYYDNFLVYVPEDFKIKDMEYADDNMSAKLKLTLGAELGKDASVNLISENGTDLCDIATGDNRKELLLNFPEALDLENQSYYISIDGIKSLSGDTLDGAKYLVSQRSAEVTSVSASKSETEITGEFYVNAFEDKTVYAVMSVWNENSCMDFKVQAVNLDSSAGEVPVEVKIESESTKDATKVQMFFVDSIENMKIISEVSETEL